jgi:hypothetical protein
MRRICLNFARIGRNNQLETDQPEERPMNAVPDPISFAKMQNADPDHKASVKHVETFWGYIIRDRTEAGTWSLIVKSLAAIIGGALFFGAIGLWVLGGSIYTQDVVVFKLGLTAVMVLTAVLLLRFASNGPKYEVQVDLNRLELREATRGDNGQVKVYSRTKFSKFDAVILERSANPQQKSRLLLRLRDTSQAIEIAQDFECNLVALKNRLAKDVIGQKFPARKKPARGFMFKAARGVVAPRKAA